MGLGELRTKIHGVVIDLDDVRGRRQCRPAGSSLWRERGWRKKTTSSAVKGSPFWNLTPLRRWKRQRVGSGVSSSRQGRDDVQILVARDQAFINVSEMPVGGALVERIGIERFELALVA